MRAEIVLRAVELVSRLLALLAGISVAVLSVLIVVDIFCRSFLRFSLQGTDELGGYVLALVGSLGFSYTLLHRGHPRIDIGLRLLPVRVKAVLHVIAYLALSGFAVFMTSRALAEFSQTLAYGSTANTPLQTPLWMPQSLWVLGTGLFALTALVLAVHAATLLFTDPSKVNARYGPPSVEEEVEDYTHVPAASERGL